MSTTNSAQDNTAQFSELTPLHLAQLCAFAFSIPQLHFCREYLTLKDDVITEKCLTRLQKGLDDAVFTPDTLQQLLLDRDYFTEQEARSRLAPAPLSLQDI